MKRPGKIHLTIYLFGTLGVSLLLGLLVREGVGSVMGALSAAGWGLVGIALFHCIPMISDATGWWILYPVRQRPSLRRMVWIRWIDEAITNLLPTAQIGGDVLRVRLIAIGGGSVSMGAATVLADLTVGVFMQIVFTVAGVVLLANHLGRTELNIPIALGAIASVVIIGLFYAVQHFGIFRIINVIAARFAKSANLQTLLENGETLDKDVRDTYARAWPIAQCILLTTFSWTLGAVEVWIGLYLVGAHPTFEKALIFESIGQGIRSIMFFVPGALGFQEGGYLMIGEMLGISGESALALSLVRRVRDLLLGVPGIVSWQLTEGRHLLRKRSAIPTA